MRKVYTKKGDEGFTTDFSGTQYAKDDVLILALGKVDFLQSAIDIAILKSTPREKEILDWVQKKLWQLSGELASADKRFLLDPIADADLILLEQHTDSFGEPPAKFVRFNTERAVLCNECRVRCRELELHLVPLLRNKKVSSIAYKWINRLSSLFFIMAYSASEK